MGLVSLIVMEPGSQWPGHVRDSENVVEVGHAGEGLLQRTRLTLASLAQRGERVRVAVLACNGTWDAPAVEDRTQVARELASAVAATGFGRLVLSASERTSMPLRRELLALAGALDSLLRGAAVLVRFSEATRGKQDWAPRRRVAERLDVPGAMAGSRRPPR